MKKPWVIIVLAVLGLIVLYRCFAPSTQPGSNLEKITSKPFGDVKEITPGEHALPGQEAVIQCKLHLSKGPCWEPYTVRITLIDYDLHKELNTFTLQKGVSYKEPMEITFNCKKNQLITYSASFSPAIWAGDEQKIFAGKHIIRVPGALPANTEFVTLKVCFSSDFQGTPEPTGVETVSCSCTAF